MGRKRLTTISSVKKYSKDKTITAAKKEEEREYFCCSCGKSYKKQAGNFRASQSPFFAGNNNYLPICINCVDDFERQYTALLGNSDLAIERLCLHWDVYFNPIILKAVNDSRSTNTNLRFSSYVSKANLAQYKGKTYDTTLKERVEGGITSIDEAKEKDINISQKTIKFFGLGFEIEDYKFLRDQYTDWTTRHECKTKAQEEVFKNLCIAQLNIQKASQGAISMKVDVAMNAFQSLLDTANLKPKQTDQNVLADQNTFGTLIKKWENEKPIPEPDEEWKDVDGIVKYITVYFLGHICKMMKIKNSYSRAYEEEMKKYKVEKPEYEDDEEGLFNSVFGDNLE